MTQHNARIT